MNKNEIIDAFNFRHACKEFDATKKISKEDFDFILETGRLSPSSFGFEPWHFLVIQNKELREKLVKSVWGGGGQFPTASHVVITLVKKGYFMRHDSEFIEHMMKDVQGLPPEVVEMKGGFYKTFQESDFDLLSSERAMDDWGIRQTYIPLANMMTTAAMIGIDSCPIEGFNMSEMNTALEKELNIDTSKFSMAYAVAFGYRKNEQSSKTRQNIDEIVTWHH